MYFGLPNKRTVPNKRTGREFLQKLINAQVQINAQGINKTEMTYKVKKTAQGKFSEKLINAHCQISSHRQDFFRKIIRMHSAFIWHIRVDSNSSILKWKFETKIAI